MSRYHNIHCKIWNDDKFPFASNDCKLVFFHLLTTPMSTQFGLFKASIPALAAELRWPVKRYKKAMDESIFLGFGKYNARFHLMLIPRFIKYNPPHNPKILISWSKAFRELPKCDLRDEFYQLLNSKINDMILSGMSESFRISFDHTFGIDLVTANATATAPVVKE